MKNYSVFNDEELVALCQQKDEDALTVLTQKYMNVAKYISGNYYIENTDSSDLVQIGMLGFLSAVYSYKSDSTASFNTYCSKCIKNSIISHLRASLKKSQPQTVPFYNEVNTPSPELTPEERTESESNIRHITEIMHSELSEKEYEIFSLHLAGFSYKEIAAKTESSEKAVDGALQRCRKKLRIKLQKDA